MSLKPPPAGSWPALSCFARITETATNAAGDKPLLFVRVEINSQRRPAESGDKALIALLQRVSEAKVCVAGKTIGKIGRGLLVLVAVHRDDGPADIERLADRIVGYRVFPDDQGRMNLSLRDAGLELLLVPQFTLTADTRKGMRASFTHGAAPKIAEDYFEQLAARCQTMLGSVECGQFGANMQVSLTNDGPVTFWLES